MSHRIDAVWIRSRSPNWTPAPGADRHDEPGEHDDLHVVTNKPVAARDPMDGAQDATSDSHEATTDDVGNRTATGIRFTIWTDEFSTL